ncbi:MAG: phosphoadenosine phosphosulfate reductase family protein [Pseudomonadota bacterium]
MKQSVLQLVNSNAGFVPDLDDYTRVLCCYSGGKDSLACALYLMELGVPREKIELWHHLVDGREGSTLMDWPITEDYAIKVAAHLGLVSRMSWKNGGIEREMLREGQPTAPISFETPSGFRTIGGRGPLGTRRKFPQVSGDLRVRWCSAYAKIDVAAAAIRNDERFLNGRVLVVTGERAEESAARAHYKQFEPHKADRRDGVRVCRHVDHWRPVLYWPEEEVWDIISRHSINPHPAYRIGFGRTSCLQCIFGSKNQWATVRRYAPQLFEPVARYEESFGVTIQRKLSIRELADQGVPYRVDDEDLLRLAFSREYTDEVMMKHWVLPPGAFGENAGPT